jgi:hypothetical protein
MMRALESKKVCATMFLLFAFSILANSISGGSLPSFGTSPVLVQGVDQPQLLADSPFGGPDPYEREGRADSPFGGPDPYEREGLARNDSPFGGPDPYEREGRADSPFGGPDPYEREGLKLTDSPFGGPDPYEREGRI